MTDTAATQEHVRPSHVSQLLTADQVAAQLGLNVYTVRRYAREGVLPAYRVGRGFRFDPATIASWLTSRVLHPAGGALVDQLDESRPARQRRAKAAQL